MGFVACYSTQGVPIEAMEEWKPLKTSPETPLDLFSVLLILFGLIIGLVVGLVTFIFEVIVNTILQRKLKNQV